MINIHIDVDNLWNYETEYNCSASGLYDLMYEQALPALLEIFDRFKVKATFFMIGRDLELASCQNFCITAAKAGHELANHTYSHPINLHRMSRQEKEKEIRQCGDRLSEIINQKIIGFRAPGYFLDQDMIEILIDNNYLYDSSVLPGFVHLLMKHFLSSQGGKKVDKAFGKKRYLVASQNITRIPCPKKSDRFLYEVPISTLPFLRLPIHSTFIYLLGLGYADLTNFLLKRFARRSILLFHGIDALDYPAIGELNSKVIPLRWALSRRLELIERILGSFDTSQFMLTKSTLENFSIREIKQSLLFKT